MKHFFLTILIALSGITLSLAQTGDSATGKTSNTVSVNPKAKVENPPTAKTNPTMTAVSGNKTIQDIISFLPVALFLFITSTIFIKLRKDGVKLSDILIDKETLQEKRRTNAVIAESHAKVATAAANAISANPNVDLSTQTFTPASSGNPVPVQDSDNPEQSTSRLIVFICGITSIALACCITSFYFYKSFTGTGDVSISGLSNVLYGLGLGVIPYGFNKIAAALK